ncbi:hypothetical protein Tco_0429460 [Tanacetum coccineum]
MNQSPLGELREASNSTNMSMMWTVMMDREEIINEAKHHKGPRIVKSVAFFREQQAMDLNLMNDLMLKIFETQLRTFDKHEFIGYAKKF